MSVFMMPDSSIIALQAEKDTGFIIINTAIIDLLQSY